jgi:hypothetical protein
MQRMRYTAKMEMKMNWDKLSCRFLLKAKEFRPVGAGMKYDDTQRRRAYSVFNAFNANNAYWSITNLLSNYANSNTLGTLKISVVGPGLH